MIDVPQLLGIAPAEFDSIESPGLCRALAYYAENRAEMDVGCEMLDADRLPAWRYFADLALKGQAFVSGEYDMEPPKTENIQDKLLQFDYLLKRRTNTPRGVVPRWCKYVFVSVDIGQYKIHYEVDGYNETLDTSQTIEWDWMRTEVKKDETLRLIDGFDAKKVWLTGAIKDTLERLRVHCSRGWPHEDKNEFVRPVLYGVDCGGTTPLEKDQAWAWSEVILDYCHPANTGGRWVALKGTKWYDKVAQRANGRHWICEEENNPKRRHDAHADWYKTQNYEACQVSEALDAAGVPVPGAHMFAAVPIVSPNDSPEDAARKEEVVRRFREHCHHLCAEKFNVQFLPGRNVEKSEKFGWQKVSPYNHGLDTRWMNIALRDIFRWRLRQPRQQFVVPKVDSNDMNRGYS